MAIERLIFDPDGDLILRLTYPEDGEEDKEHEGNDEEEDSVNGDGVSSKLTCPAMTPVESNSNIVSEIRGPSPRELEMLVSSKHLMLVSPVFKAMFSLNFREGVTLRSTGTAEIRLDDDPSAFSILLYIIHCMTRKVPNEVSLEVLTTLSVLVDKYQMLEIVELHVRLWLPALENLLPKSM